MKTVSKLPCRQCKHLYCCFLNIALLYLWEVNPLISLASHIHRPALLSPLLYLRSSADSEDHSSQTSEVLLAIFSKHLTV